MNTRIQSSTTCSRITLRTVPALALVVTLLIGLLSGVPTARAGKVAGSFSYVLIPPAVDPPEPSAYGKCTENELAIVTAVSCKRLTPGNHYRAVVLAPVYSPYPEGHYDFYETVLDLTADHKGCLAFEYPGFFVQLENETGGVVLEKHEK